jgi:hypothetical protein
MKSEILEQKSLKDAFVFCKLKNVMPAQYGSLLEHYIIKKEEGMKKTKESGSGDCEKDGVEYEIKVSFYSSAYDGFMFDGIRLNRKKVDYLLYAYLLNEETVDRLGELFKFKMMHDEMKDLVLKYGNYKGLTRKEIGASVAESLSEDSLNNRLVYKLNFHLNSPCWKEMTEKYLMK